MYVCVQFNFIIVKNLASNAKLLTSTKILFTHLPLLQNNFYSIKILNLGS